MPIDNVICNARVDVFYALKTFIAKEKQTSVSKLAESKEGKVMNKGHVLYHEQTWLPYNLLQTVLNNTDDALIKASPPWRFF